MLYEFGTNEESNCAEIHYHSISLNVYFANFKISTLSMKNIFLE